MSAATRTRTERYVLITGGAGFIGTNLAHRLLSSGQNVMVYDNLSRPGVEQNLRWLQAIHGSRLQVMLHDVRDRVMLQQAATGAAQVFHLAAQVAVTTSLTNPLDDFAVNAHGTLHLLEALRSLSEPPPLVFTSTNKVYGGLEDLVLVQDGKRYKPLDYGMRKFGIDEARPLDFHSPYGCSKGAADQYVLDYARTYGLPAVVFRMSCIYGPHQMGTEDQGWVAHFVASTLRQQPITLYGDGMQIRDVLYVDDLVDALLLAQKSMSEISGQAFNIGGGPRNTTSLMELITTISDVHGLRPDVYFDAWRPGDQRYYVSDTRKFRAATGWTPRVGIVDGVRRLHAWLTELRGVRPATSAMHNRPMPEPTRSVQGLPGRPLP